MRKLKDIYVKQHYDIEAKMFYSYKPVISYEIFPPKNDEDGTKTQNLFEELKVLSKYNPAFISVTYGAGGSTRNSTFDLIKKIKSELDITPMPHFTCVGHNKENIYEYIKQIENEGIKNILALRGDPPKGQDNFVKPEGGFEYANELVEFIKEHTDLSIAVAGYPEKHTESVSFADDIKNLAGKINSGGDVIITQVFYDNEKFFDYKKKLEEYDIKVPVIPGILPLTNINQVERMIAMTGTSVPKALIKSLEQYKDDKKAMQEIGIDYALYQCQQLVDAKVEGLHFYTLNKSYATKEIIEGLM